MAPGYARVGDYLDHLTRGGHLVVVAHHTTALLRVLSVSLAALEERGIGTTSAMEQIYTVGAPDLPALVLRNGVFRPEESQKYYRLMKQLGYTSDPAYLPHVDLEQAGAISQRLEALARGEIGWEELAEAAGFDIHPVTDDRPFFYHFELGLPAPVVQLFVTAGYETAVSARQDDC